MSIATGGGQSNGDSDLATISGDGRYVAFASDATNLVKGDTNKNVDIFVRDRLKGTTERVDLTWNGAQIDKGSAGWGIISNDGRYVSFGSAGAKVVKGVTHGADLFVRDRVKGTTELASLNGSIALPRGISGQGRYVSFESYDARHVKGDTNRNKDVFVYDRTTRKTVRASVSSTGQQGNRDSYGGALSPTGATCSLTPTSTTWSRTTQQHLLHRPALHGRLPPRPRDGHDGAGERRQGRRRRPSRGTARSGTDG